jgi:Protein of unknown function DUF262/Protein of unknown function (DUF1524)
MAGSAFQFESPGIGKLLRQGRLEVPPNQRSYAWREPHVRNLLQDLNEAVTGGNIDEYFLGTIVLIQRSGEPPSIVDGQQRLATTTILLSRIRDHLLSISRKAVADFVEETFLSNIDLKTEQRVPRLKLNLEDNEFFAAQILPVRATTPAKSKSKKRSDVFLGRPSNRRLSRTSDMADTFITDITKNLPLDAQADLLIRWVEFIETNVNVLVLTVPDDVSAFRMFETLNDRGLKASQADILKNYFLSRVSQSRLTEAQMMWNTVSNTVYALELDKESDDDSDSDRASDRLVTYIRHLWITTHGPTKERELAAQIRLDVNNEVRTFQYLSDGSEGVQDYAALWSANHPKWAQYKPTTKQHIETMAEFLKVRQIRPLMFAVARHFEPTEADKAFKLFVSWSVRFLIFGGRGGMLDMQYSIRAREVGTGQITTARELREAMRAHVPTDREFETAFATARVSRGYLARYYLRALENTAKQLSQPEYVANDSVADITLEHIMPLQAGEDWDVDDDLAEATQKFLGNMVLLKASQNRDLGNMSFDEKRVVYKRSGYDLTREVAQYEKWTSDEIRERQARLAQLAVKTWSLDLSG